MLVLGEIPRNRKQLIPVSPLTDVQRAVSSDLEIAMAEKADNSPDNIERMVSVDPTSILNALLSVLSASSNDRWEKVAAFRQQRQQTRLQLPRTLSKPGSNGKQCRSNKQ